MAALNGDVFIDGLEEFCDCFLGKIAGAKKLHLVRSVYGHESAFHGCVMVAGQDQGPIFREILLAFNFYLKEDGQDDQTDQSQKSTQ